MPSSKPKIVVRTEQEIVDKIKYIAKENERSTSQEVAYLIKQEIAKFEKERGEIIIEREDNHKWVAKDLDRTTKTLDIHKIRH